MIRSKEYRKLNDFITKHNSLIAEFQENQSIQSKFKTLKNTINIFSHYTVKSIQPSRNISPTSFHRNHMQQSQQIYIKQLNKMCEGNELFELSKLEEKNKLLKKGKDKQLILTAKKQTKSLYMPSKVHYKAHYLKKKEENQQNRKFLQLPNFQQILKGCSLAYSKQTHASQLKRKINRFKNNLGERNNFDEVLKKASLHKINWNKNSKNSLLRMEIQQLKKKAKDQYQLDFDSFKQQKNTNQNDAQLSKLKEKQLCTFFEQKQNIQAKNELQCLNLVNQNEIEVRESQNIEKNQNNQQKSYIPKKLLNYKQKYRPNSVCSSIFRTKRNKKQKLNYFRV